MFVLAATKVEDRSIIKQVKRVSDHEFATLSLTLRVTGFNFSYSITLESHIKVRRIKAKIKNSRRS